MLFVIVVEVVSEAEGRRSEVTSPNRTLLRDSDGHPGGLAGFRRAAGGFA